MRRTLVRPVVGLFVIGFLTSLVSAAESNSNYVRIGSGVKGHVHPAMCVTKDGAIVVIYSQSDYKDLRISRSEDGGKTWSESAPVPGTETLTFYPGSLTTLKDGRVVHFWNTWYQDPGMKAKSRYPEFSISTDGGKTWRPSTKLPKNPDSHSVIRHPLVELGDDAWLLPLTDKTIVYQPSTGKITPFGDGRNHGLTPIVRTPTGTYVSGLGLRSTDDGKTWEKLSPFPQISDNGWRFDLAVLPNGWLVAGEVVGPGFGGDLWRFVVSKDDGKTWNFDHAHEFYKPGRPINGRACPKTLQIEDSTIGTVFYDYAGCDKEPGVAGVFFLRTPLDRLK